MATSPVPRTLGAVLLFCSGVAFAAAEVNLSTIEISATGQRDTFTPMAPSQEINATDINNTNSINTEEAIKYQPELVIRSRYIGDSNALVAMRDSSMMQSARSLVMVDGMLLSNFLGAGYSYAPLWATTAPEEIESIKVLYGPFDAQYSGNSMGGAVVMQTRLPNQFEAYVKGTSFLQTFSDYGQSDHLPGFKTSASLGSAKGAWHYRLLASYTESQGQPMSYGLAKAGGAGSNSVSGALPYENTFVTSADSITKTTDGLYKFELGYDLRRTLQLRAQVAYQQSNREQLNPHPFLTDASGNPLYAGNVSIGGAPYIVTGTAMSFSDSDRLLTGVSLQGELNERWSTASNISWFKVLNSDSHRSAVNYTNLNDNGAGKLTENNGSNWGNIDLRLARANDGGWGGNQTRFGYHVDQYQLDDSVFDVLNWRQAQKSGLVSRIQGTSRTQAVYLQNEWQLAANLLLNLGVRQEHWQAFDARFDKDAGVNRVGADYPERSENATSPKFSLDYFPSNQWQVTTLLARAVRFPTLGELYQGGIDNNGNFQNKFNPNLKAETGLHADLGITRFMLNGQWRVDLWQNRIKDSILQQTNQYTGISSFQNIDKTVSTGLSFSGKWQDLLELPLSLNTNAAYTRPKIVQDNQAPTANGKDIPRVPRWRANVFASYQLHPLWQLSSGLRYSSDPYDTLDNSDGERSGFGYTDKFLVWDAKLGFTQKHWSWALGVNNINNERYYVYHPYPGRTFFMEAQWHAF